LIMGKMTMITSALFPWMLSMVVMVAWAGDPVLEFEWKVTYGTHSPLGTPEQLILINGQFPGPNLNTTTNNNVVINIFNELDEPLLFTWCVISFASHSCILFAEHVFLRVVLEFVSLILQRQ